MLQPIHLFKRALARGKTMARTSAVTTGAASFHWPAVSDAVAYEVVLNEGKRRLTLVTDRNEIAVRGTENARVHANALQMGEFKRSALKVNTSASLPDETKVIDLAEFRSYDIERLPIPRFNLASDATLKITEDTLNIEWQELKRATALEIKVTRKDGGYKAEYLVPADQRSWVLDTTKLDEGSYRIDAHSMFANRWGKWVNVTHLEIGSAQTREIWRKSKIERDAAREAFNHAAAKRDKAGNALALLNDLEARKTELAALPTRICVMLGYDCNLDCLMCDEGRVRRPHKIPPSLVDDVINYALPSLTVLQITGGEPMMYDETERLCSAAEAYPELNIKMCTNGSLLTEKWAKRIARGNYDLQISIDGATKETYEKVRRKSDFDKLVANLERVSNEAKLLGKKLTISVNYVIQKANDMK